MVTRTAAVGSLLVCLLSLDPVFGQTVAEGPKQPAVSATVGSVFQPGDFKSLGRLTVPPNGKVIFNTGDETNTPTVSGAVTGKGQLGLTKSGKVQLAVFCFDDISVPSGATVEVTGNRGLVLLSKGGATIDTTIDLSGKVGASSPVKVKPEDAAFKNSCGDGGPGGEGGERNKTFRSNPPPADGGDGGPAMKDSGRNGYGFGAGMNYRVQGGVSGSGGGYGGVGGDTSEGSSARTSNRNPKLGEPTGKPQALPGGPSYGDAALTDLFGGSGGAGGSNDRAYQSAGGGGGGGAIEIVSSRSIAIGPKGRILATGGAGAKNKVCGGGGSGGAVLLTAPAITLADGAVVDASGGVGGDGGPEVAAEIKPENGRRNSGSGGGGGGGRIAFNSRNDFGATGKNREERALPRGVSVNGGKGGSMARDGAAGTFYDGDCPVQR